MRKCPIAVTILFPFGVVCVAFSKVWFLTSNPRKIIIFGPRMILHWFLDFDFLFLQRRWGRGWDGRGGGGFKTDLLIVAVVHVLGPESSRIFSSKWNR